MRSGRRWPGKYSWSAVRQAIPHRSKIAVIGAIDPAGAVTKAFFTRPCPREPFSTCQSSAIFVALLITLSFIAS